MKPPRFQYCAPRRLEEALTLLDQQREETKVLAGGQSLVPLLNMRLAGPSSLVDINQLAELHYLEPQEGSLAIGATVHQREVERSAVVQAKHPLLVDVVTHIGHPPIRNRGTIAGSIAHADPAAELPALLTCLGGEVLARSRQGERIIKAETFFTGYLSTALEPGELLTEVRFPWLAPRAGWACLDFTRRTGDFALVGVIAVLTPGADDRCGSAQLAYFGIAGAPLRAQAVEQLLVGTTLDAKTLEAAAEAAGTLVGEEMSDVHATVAYRRVLTGELTKRALTAAWERRAR